MTLTDDELTALITARYADATSRIGLAEVERRGRRRRRNGRLTLTTAIAATVLAVIGGSTYVVDRIDQNRQVAAFNAACQKAYAEETAATLRAADLPPALGEPIIELRNGDAAIRLYATAVPGKPTVVFDCARMADGTTSGRLSSRTRPAEGPPPIEAYRALLPDGSAAIVGWLADPTAKLTLTPPEVAGLPSMKLAAAQGYVVVWGPRDAIGRARLELADGARFDIARDRQHQPWTFQEAEFADHCVGTIRQSERGEPILGLTLRMSATDQIRVYRARGLISVCSWQLLPDLDSFTYHGPMLNVSSSSTEKDDGSDGLGLFLSVGDTGYLVGLTPPQTNSVRLTSTDGDVIDALLGDGVFAAADAIDPQRRTDYKVTMTTATYVYTFGDGPPKKTPR
jgi:hypothetical protein